MNMALSKKDQEFYEDKLSLKWAGYMLLSTAIVGAIGVPVALYLQDLAAGTTNTWSTRVVANLAEMGFMLGIVVAVIMYLGFKLLLQLGWLPARR